MNAAYPASARPAQTAWIRDNHHSRLLACMIWALIVLMIVPDGFDYRSLAGSGPTSSGGALSRLLWMGLLASSSLLVVWRMGLAWLLVRTMNPFLLVFVALAFLSVAWSIDPALSLRRLIRLGTIGLACSAFVLAGWHARRLQQVLRPILTVMLAGSIVFALVFPELGIHQQSAAELVGAWRGLASHKNGLGALASLGLIFWLHAWLTREVRVLPALAGGTLAIACLLLSRSSTSLLATVFVAMVMWLMLRAPRGLRPYMGYLVWPVAALLVLYALALMNVIPGLGTLLAPVTALTSKDTSLTGRTEIWAILADHIRHHPLLGTGYGAYWTAEPVPGTDAYAFVTRMGSFYPGSAHNGYLEVVNDLGWVGFAALLAYMFVHVGQSLRLMRLEYHQATLYVALFCQQAITNLSESHWFSVLSVHFVIMTLTTMAVARGLVEYRLRFIFGRPPP